MTPMSSRSTIGDLVFMTPSANAISEMIKKYDRGDYTHVGIDMGDGSVVNCRTEGELIKAGENGGVRVDRFEDITDRELWRAPVKLDEPIRKAAVARTEPWIEKDGRGKLSGFSFPKMFQCAVAVDAKRPEADFSDEARNHMLGTAFRAAEVWRYVPERPSFFCAEMVVEAFGAEVPTEYLEPPWPRRGFLQDVLVDAAGLAHDVVEAIKGWQDSRAWTMGAVVAAVTRHDPDFFGGALLSVLKWMRDSGHDTTQFEEQARGELPDTLPPALVTPRMLLRCDWVGEPERIRI